MKQLYETPLMDWIRTDAEDILTMSDNDAPFLPPAGGDDDGWSGYH